MTMETMECESKNTRLAYYPGPRGYPLIGNALQIGRFPWIQLAKWSEEYGPIYSAKLGPQYALIVNSHRIANELLDRRSAIYSDRPRMIMLNEIMTQHLFLPTIPYGDSWRKLRKAISEVLNHRSIESFLPVVQRKMILLVETLAKNPHDTKWMQDIIASISMTAFALGYGDTPSQSSSDEDKSRRKEIEDFMHRVERTALPGEHLVELLPWLNRLPTWFPGMKWKTRGLEWHEKDTQMFEKLYKDAATAQKEGKSSKSFVSITSKEYEAHEMNPGLDLTFKERAWMAGNLYGAGSSTTSAFALMFILAMVTNPQVMRKAQAQIDEVVGRDRTPCLKDKDELPYIRALLREVFRWRSGSPLGVPHYSTEDGEYDGRFIPKGTLIMFNVWAMNREYPTFPDPDNFRPERFLDETETKDYVPPHTHIDGHTTFGYGRRKCPGAMQANNILFIYICTLLWTFDVLPVEGQEPSINDFDDDNGMVLHPKPFPVKFVPRQSFEISLEKEANDMARTRAKLGRKGDQVHSKTFLAVING
ncbi:cytochrome P450 family protein [Abortiporus biennis]